MKITDLGTTEVYYDDKEDDKLEFAVTGKFWRRLKRTGIAYRTGGKKGNICYTEERILKLTSPSFKKVFREIALSEIGKMAMRGDIIL